MAVLMKLPCKICGKTMNFLINEITDECICPECTIEIQKKDLAKIEEEKKEFIDQILNLSEKEQKEKILGLLFELITKQESLNHSLEYIKYELDIR